MICPVCGKSTIVLEYNRIELDICPECDGVWFDQNELELLLGSLNLGEPLGRPLDRKTDEPSRKCPYCRRKMEKILVGSKSEVMIDRCGGGHGLWLDGGELDGIIRSLQTANGERTQKVGSFLKGALPEKEPSDPEGSTKH